MTKRKPKKTASIYSQGPVLDGEYYCSPWCGYRCTVEMHKKAQRRAFELCQTLGKGWTPRVWENLGWHFEAISPCGRLKVSYAGHAGSSYIAFLGDAGSTGGRWVEHGQTPESACRKVIRRGHDELREVHALIDDLPKFPPLRRRKP